MSTDIVFKVRSNEQLLLLLKLVDVNHIETKRRNVNVRKKIWKEIAAKLNRLSANGAEKDADGWKRCFKTWSLGVGPDYKAKMQELIQKVPSDVNYLITVSEDEEEQSSKVVDNVVTVNPIESQKQLLHDLILEHKALLLSSADDEPLKVRLWQNVSMQLNSIPGALNLTPEQWKQSVDLEKYRTKRGRKRGKRPKNPVSESRGTNSSHASNDETTQASTSSQGPIKANSPQNNNITISTKIINNLDRQLEELNADEYEDSDDEDENLTESDFMPYEDDDTKMLYEPLRKRIRSTPLVKNFKFSRRMVNAVEQLKEDVQCVNDTLKETTDSLISIRNIMERQCEQQDELNALLKRSTQLLKVLVEFKIGKRTSISKRNFHFNNESGGT